MRVSQQDIDTIKKAHEVANKLRWGIDDDSDLDGVLKDYLNASWPVMSALERRK